ncbi:UCH-domain-containing protein [Ascodesmis nigricans]|uniref:ubiquitinyl hydrolase 1 n=1 Tax=Ascodesmis nigricans TaxID=341454 RepID=A0A4S2MI87_9PEZI|nr:UCH-domain-containing protein [Ascodesmis nigricans]
MTDQQEQTQQSDGPPFLGPKNPISKKPPSRSQSPAKRLKSEDPPTTTTHNPVGGDDDGDAVMEDADQPGRSRLASVEMVDADEVDSGTATNGQTSTAPSTTDTAPPTVEIQVQSIALDKACPLEDGKDYYIISGSWLKRFMAQLPEHAKEVSKEELERPLGPIDNSGIVDTAQLEEIERRRSNDSQSTVSNDLMDDYVPLKQAQLGEDFEILSAKAWNDLVAWYGLSKDSPVIRRKAVNIAEDVGSENIQVELYPPTFIVYRLRDPSIQVTRESLDTEKKQKPKKLVSPRSEGFQRFLKKIKTVAGVEATRKVRIWKVNSDLTNETEKSSKKKAGTFKQMVLDLQPFLEFPQNDMELVDIKDQTNDPNYNGKGLKIGMAGLGTGGAIIIEEQSSDGGWISEAPVNRATKFGEVVTVLKHGFNSSKLAQKKKQEKEAKAPASGESSVGKSLIARGSSIFMRGRDKREGKPLGTCGLSNLGNTCYMNSALQCLRAVEELSKYFLLDEHKKELNPSNPLSHNGKVAMAYAGLLHNIFSPNASSSFAPRDFKNTIGRFGPSFLGYQQQDSQEFLAFLLDGLHEDLNRIVKKPYIERPDSTDDMVGDQEKIAKLAETHWNIYKKRNDSAVADLFAGLYKSTLVCPDCGKVSITFDPFMDLTLPLPIESLWSHQVIFYPLYGGKHTTPVYVPVEMAKHTSMASLKEFVGKKFGVDPKKIMGSESYKNRFFKHYDDGKSVSEEITSQTDLAVFYELDHIPTNWPGPKKKATPSYQSSYYNRSSEDRIDDTNQDPAQTEKMLVPVFHQRRTQAFGLPMFIVLTREEQNSYEAILRKIFNQVQILTTRDMTEALPEAEIELDDDDEASVENISKPKINLEKPDNEKDGFVDVSMQDAESVTDAEEAKEAEAAPKQQAPVREKKVTPQVVSQLFEVSVVPSNGERIQKGFNHLTGAAPLAARLNRSRSPSPIPQKHGSGVSLAARGSGMRTPDQSDVSDNDDILEPEEPGMQDASDDDLEPSYATQNTIPPFTSIKPSGFYGTANGSSPAAPRPSPSPRNLSPAPPPPTTSPKPLLRLGEAILLDWTDTGYDALFGGSVHDTTDFRGIGTWEPTHIPVLEDETLNLARRRREERRARGIHLEDCLDEFAKEEVLSADDPWFCPKCKEHRRATKKFELWKCPDILVVHLKRFSASRSFRDKIDVMIECPIEGLDLAKRVGVTEGKGMVYDLIAVDNHYGGLGGGHYTASVRNWYNGKWYYCDDSSVRETSTTSVVTPAAYLLFYRRRSDQNLGGKAYTSLLAASDAKARLLSAEGVDDDADADADTEQEPLGGSESNSPSDSDDDDNEEGGMNILSPAARTFGSSSSSSGGATGYGARSTPTSLYHQAPVGNATLWGASMPVRTEDGGDVQVGEQDADGEELPSYEESFSTVKLNSEASPATAGAAGSIVKLNGAGDARDGDVEMVDAAGMKKRDEVVVGRDRKREGVVDEGDDREDNDEEMGGVMVLNVAPLEKEEEEDREAVEVRV